MYFNFFKGRATSSSHNDVTKKRWYSLFSNFIWFVEPISISLGLDQTSNYSRDEQNSNLGRPELSLDRLLGQTSNLGRPEPINWIIPKSNFNKFSPENVKYTLPYKYLIY